MRIHKNFPGGNIQVHRIEGADVYIEQEIRDTSEWWFYWAFCVEGAQGETVTFHFENRDVVGYWGPCVSEDDFLYTWAGADTRVDGHTFVYRFGAAQERVYFRVALPYQQKRFDWWARQQQVPVGRYTLCQSERGREVPYYLIGDMDASRTIYLISRHHACESVGTYVLEGALDLMVRQAARVAALDMNVIAIPFVDLDGVEDGDQGKARLPHDHNRDYIAVPHYASSLGMERVVRTFRPYAMIDFHNPWLLGGENDHVYIPKADPAAYRAIDQFGTFLKEETAKDTAADAIRYDGLHDIRAGEGWLAREMLTSTCNAFFKRQEAAFSTVIEVPYFGLNTPYTRENTRQLGEHVASALLSWIEWN